MVSSPLVTNAVFEDPTSAAVASLAGSASSCAARTTPAGLPPAGSVVKAAYLATSGAVSVIPPRSHAGALRCHTVVRQRRHVASWRPTPAALRNGRAAHTRAQLRRDSERRYTGAQQR